MASAPSFTACYIQVRSTDKKGPLLKYPTAANADGLFFLNYMTNRISNWKGSSKSLRGKGCSMSNQQKVSYTKMPLEKKASKTVPSL